MSNVFSLLPGQLNVTFMVGDEVNVAINLGGQNITGYTLDSKVYVVSSAGFQGGGGGTSISAGEVALVPTIQVVNATTGSIVWSLTEAQTASIYPAVKYSWSLRWITPGTVMTRTILAGLCIPKAPGA